MTSIETKLSAIAIACLLTLTGCLGIFGGDEADTTDANTTSFEEQVGNQTAQEIQARSAGQFSNYTIAGQEDLEDKVLYFNGSIGPGPTYASHESRNDRSGTKLNTEYRMNDISGEVPEGQPVELRLKMWYFPGPGSSGDLDVAVDVPGTETDWAGDDCDAFSWKFCVQERVVNTVGTSEEPMNVGVQISNNRAVQSMDYFFEVQINYAEDVVAPGAPFAFDVNENATGLILSSEKAGGGEHIVGEFLVVGPNDDLVEYRTYNDLALASESVLVPIDGAGEYIIYAPELHGGFLSVEADVPVPKDIREGRILSTTETVTEDGTGPSPGYGETCYPLLTCASVGQYSTTSFVAEGTFPLEIHAWIGSEDTPAVNADAEVNILNPDGELVSVAKDFVKAEQGDNQVGLSRDEFTYESHFGNLTKGEYTVQYVSDGNAAVGHTVITYSR